MHRKGFVKINQLAAWINTESEKLGWTDTQTSNKWYKLDNGDFIFHPAGPIEMLGQLFDDAELIFENGPANLWRALWGNAFDPSVLWPLCRTRFSSEGPWLDDAAWRKVETTSLKERTFYETIREFEGEILIALAHREPLTLNHLTEAVALYRLHQTINSLAVSHVDGIGAYRCVQHCLNATGIFHELNSYDGFFLVRDELENMEKKRLDLEDSYRASIGLAKHEAPLYANASLSWITDADRWDALDLDWAPSERRPPQSLADQISDRRREINAKFDPGSTRRNGNQHNSEPKATVRLVKD